MPATESQRAAEFRNAQTIGRLVSEVEGWSVIHSAHHQAKASAMCPLCFTDQGVALHV